MEVNESVRIEREKIIKARQEDIRRRKAERERKERIKREREEKERIRSRRKMTFSVGIFVFFAIVIALNFDKFVVYLKIIGIVVGLTIVSLFVSCMNSLPNYTKPHRYIVQDEIYNNDDDL